MNVHGSRRIRQVPATARIVPAPDHTYVPVSGRAVRTASRHHRLSRILTAAALCVTAAVASLGLTAPSASAATVVNWPVSCAANSGSFGRNLTLYLSTQPVGTTVEADLYKYVPSTGRWVYQNAYDWLRVNAGGQWQRPGYTVTNFIQLTGWSTGSYALYIYQWNAQNVLLYQGWSNSCYFPN
jgi:hypothetical protein